MRGRAHGGRTRAVEIESFRTQVAQMRDTLRGEATLESMEEWVRLKMTIDRTGHVTVKGTVREQPGTGNTLSFRIDELDQTDLGPLVAPLDAALFAFPIVGPPR